MCVGAAAVLCAQSPQPQSVISLRAESCAGCHGGDMTGASGPSILTYVRFHVDKEITEIIRKGHHGVPAQMPDDELRQMLADLRKLAGTNPAMATGGYTGSRLPGPPPRVVSLV